MMTAAPNASSNAVLRTNNLDMKFTHRDVEGRPLDCLTAGKGS
jgi:hypothetical protein